MTLGICAQRIRNKEHSVAQCGVGVVTGALGAALYFNSELHERVSRDVRLNQVLKDGSREGFAVLVACFVGGAAVVGFVGRWISQSGWRSKAESG